VRDNVPALGVGRIAFEIFDFQGGCMLKLRATLVLVWFVCLTSISMSRTFYVTKSGNDNNNGTSWATAWATTAKVNASIARGDTVRFGSGRWYKSQIIPPTGGSSSLRTVYACSTYTDASQGLTTITSGDSVTGWTVYSGSIYRAAWSRPSGMVSGADNAIGVRVATQNDTLLYNQSSLANVSGPGQQFYDGTYLYVWCWNGGSPAGRRILATMDPTVLINNDAMDYLTFRGLNFQMGKQGVVEMAAVDSVIFSHCDFAFGSEFTANNPCLIWSGRDNDVMGNNNSFIACSFHDVCHENQPDNIPPDTHNGAAAIIYAQNHMVFDSCYFYRLTGDAVHWKAAYALNTGNTVRYSRIVGSSGYFIDAGVVIGMYTRNDSVYGCTFSNLPNMGIQLGEMGAVQNSQNQGRHAILNNTFYNCGIFFDFRGYAPPDLEYVKYNIGYDISGGSTFLTFQNENSRIEPNCKIDSNYWFDPTTAFSGYCFDATRNLQGWRDNGFDAHCFNVNPGLTNPANLDFSRNSSSQEMSQTYGGRSWTRFGAWQPSGGPSYIDQFVSKASTSSTATLTDDLTGGSSPYDSLVLHWSTVRANVVALSARDTRVTAASDPYVFSKTGLSPSTKYYFRALAFDSGAIGDTTAIDSVTTTVLASIDQVITKSSNTNSATLSDDLSGGTAPYDSLVLHWSTVRANVAALTARDTRVTAASDPYVFSKTSLSPSTKYYFRVLAFDAGATGDTTAIDSVTTTVLASIDQVITKSSNTNSATLSDDLSGGTAPYDSLVLHWSTVRANVVALTARDSRVTAASDPYVFSKTALSPSTKYYFRVLAFDAGVIGDTTAIDSVTTTAQTSIDQIVTKSTTDTQVTLNDDLSGGSAPYDSLVLYWSVTRANIVNLSARDLKVTAAADPYQFSKTGLTANTKYYFRISAFDSGSLGDTTAIDSATTSAAGLVLLSVNVPDTVSGTYSGYSQTPVNDGTITPRGGTATTWASDESSTSSHWVTMYFTSPMVVQRARIYWAWNGYNSTWMCSRQYSIQYWDAASSVYRDAAVVNNSTVDSMTTTDFTPVTTTRIRYYQAASMGPTNYPIILWLTELQVYGNTQVDNTPPVLNGITASNITPGAATIGWTSNEPATSQVDYGLTTSYGMSTTLDNALLVSHSQVLSGLTESTIYHYRVKSRDAAGNLATSGDFTFTTGSTLQLISVNVPDTVSGTYSGYSQTPINDGVIAPRGGTVSTWASDESSTSPHWITIYFSSPKVVQRTVINWAWNNKRAEFMTSRQFYIQYWDASNSSYRDAIFMDSPPTDSCTISNFAPVTTSRIRYYQPANQGPTNYRAILWLTEFQVYGYNPPGTLDNGETIAANDLKPGKIDDWGAIPDEFALNQSYPNPFNAQATIEYALPTASQVSLVIYDITGSKVEVLVNEYQQAGYHRIVWNAENMPSSTYFYRLNAGDFSQSKKMLLLK
jgi:hypothetical protein